jgi:hypothetical protein
MGGVNEKRHRKLWSRYAESCAGQGIWGVHVSTLPQMPHRWSTDGSLRTVTHGDFDEDCRMNQMATGFRAEAGEGLKPGKRREWVLIQTAVAGGHGPADTVSHGMSPNLNQILARIGRQRPAKAALGLLRQLCSVGLMLGLPRDAVPGDGRWFGCCVPIWDIRNTIVTCTFRSPLA